MTCQDILVNRSLSFTEINLGISQMFCIKTSEILVVDEIPLDPLPNQIRLLSQVQDVEGDFKKLISIYLKDNSLSIFCIEEMLGIFCEKFRCACLISNDSVNPYCMTIVKGVGDYSTVYLSPERLDEGEYIVEPL